MAEFDDLPPLQRAKRYRALAQDARNEAAAAKGAPRQSYLLSAEKWDKLAEEIVGDVTWRDLKSKPEK